MKQAQSTFRIWNIPVQPERGTTGFIEDKRPTTTANMHALNIGTMSLWMMFSSACLAGMILSQTSPEPFQTETQASIPETIEITMSERFGPADGIPADENAADPPELVTSAEAPPPVGETPPPKMPAISEITPLPAVPSLPAPVPAAIQHAPRPQTATTNRSPENASRRPVRAGNPEKRGAADQPGNPPAVISPARRLAGGSMPKPKYPAAARSRGQTGTVVIEFVVGENGRVVSARASTPSPWPLLNEAAVKAVRGWRFPPGGMTTYTRPIIFNLN